MHFKIPNRDILSLRKVVKAGALFVFNMYNSDVDHIKEALIEANWSAPELFETPDLPKNHKIYWCRAM